MLPGTPVRWDLEWTESWCLESGVFQSRRWGSRIVIINAATQVSDDAT